MQTKSIAKKYSRRVVLRGSTAVGTFVMASHFLPSQALAAKMTDPPMPNAFVRIAPDSSITIIIKHLEMGQGITTGLSTIVAEELDADWRQMRFEFAPINTEVYNNLHFGPLQGTGSSNSISNSWLQLRKTAAAMRAMLIAAAAQEWKVLPSDIFIENGTLKEANGKRTATFGTLAAKAAAMPVPADPKLKDPKDFKLIGALLPRLDVPTKLTGRATYTMDVRLPGQLTAMVAHAPRFGAKVQSFDDSGARKVAGVVNVVSIPSGIAVIANDTWSAKKGRDALKIKWDFSSAENRSSEDIMVEYKSAARSSDLLTAAARGDANHALSKAAKIIEAEYEFPYLAHASLEPTNAVIEPTADGVTLWAGSQSQTLNQTTIATVMGIAPTKVSINTLLAGGSFGRRSDPHSDYVSEAVHILKASGSKAPIHLVWTREDDMTAGLYRTMAYHKIRAGLDEAGNVTAWHHIVVGKSITLGTVYEPWVIKNGVDGTTVHGVVDMAYKIPNFSVLHHNGTEGVPVLWWRSVGHSHTAYAVESFIDELAYAARKDPLQYRLDLLKEDPRRAGVLRLVAEKSGWGSPMPKGQGRGIAVHEPQRTPVAMVAEVTVNEGKIRVDRIVAAVDCGIAINPDNIRAQFEGGVGFALSSVLRNKITLANGEVQQVNFDTYEPTRFPEMPKVEVHIVPSAAPPTGVGEPCIPCIAPAIANAVFAATGTRLRSLPLKLSNAT